MMRSHTGCICLTFLRCVFSNISSYREMVVWEENWGVVLLFSTVCFQMLPACEDAKSLWWRFKFVTKVDGGVFLHCPFSNIQVKMRLSGCDKGRWWLFSTVSFLMWFSPLHFQTEWGWRWGFKFLTKGDGGVGGEFRCRFTFLHCVFSNESSNHLPVKRHSHIVCICLTFFQCMFP